MIQTEPFMTRRDGVELVRTYSDAGFKIRQLETGAIYADAIDVLPLRYSYEETDIRLEEEDMESPEESVASDNE